jgi:hypothetical protein
LRNSRVSLYNNRGMWSLFSPLRAPWIAILCGLFFAAVGCQKGMEQMKVIMSQDFKQGKLVLKNRDGELKPGSNQLFVEFQDSAGNLLQIDDADMSAVMPRPGMSPMATPVSLSPTAYRGRFMAQPVFETSGEWKVHADYSGPSGHGDISFTLIVK